MARRQPNQRTGSLVAAATRISLRDGRITRGKGVKKHEWQAEAWAYFNEVPEVKYGTRFLGNAFAKLTLYVGMRPTGSDADAEPVPITDQSVALDSGLRSAALAELARLNNSTGGISALLSRLNMNLEVAGELWLVGWGERPMVGDPGDPGTEGDPNAMPPVLPRAARPPSADYKPAEPEQWQVASVSEIQAKGGKYSVKADPSDTKGRQLDPDLDVAIRIWEQHAEWAGLADCAMRGVLNDCKALQVLVQQQYAESLSQMSAGVLLLPNTLTVGKASPTDPDSGDDDEDPVIAALMAVSTDPIEDPSSAASVAPTILKGPKEDLEAFRHVLMGRFSDEVLDKRIEARIQRVARGLNLPVEVVMGHQQTTFANAEQVDQDTFEDHLEPRCRLVAEALTVGFLRPGLRETFPSQGDVIDQLVVWYDASALVRQPDTEANADSAHEHFAISDEAYRKAKGYSEDDAPSVLEVLNRAGLRRGILTAELTAALLQALADEAGVELPSPEALAPGGPPTDAAARNQAIAAALLASALKRGNPRDGTATTVLPPVVTHALEAASRRTPSWNPGRDLTAIDRELRIRLHVAAEAAVHRAMEKAGARARTRGGAQYRTLLAAVDNTQVCATLGPRIVEGLQTTDEALDGAWLQLEQQFRTWGAGAQADALDVAGRAVAGFSVGEREALMLRQATDLDEAWAWMREALQALAAQALFDPNPAAPTVGEFDPSMRVPPGLVRQAIARAGGTAGLIAPDSGGAFVTLADAGTRPAGGIGTGELMRGVFRDHGVPVEGYVWVYGPAHRQRPFPPHQELDGTTFVNFDDDVLANSSGFPDSAFYMPGDHDGCICDVEPIIIPADEA